MSIVNNNYVMEMCCDVISNEGIEDNISFFINFYDENNYEMHSGQCFDTLYDSIQKYIDKVKPGYNIDDVPEKESEK